MDKKEVLAIIDKSSQSLMMKLNEKELNDLLNDFDQLSNEMQMLKDFDLTPYQDMVYLDDPVTQNRLREDEIINCENPEEQFVNVISFEDNMVVVKNEK